MTNHNEYTEEMLTEIAQEDLRIEQDKAFIDALKEKTTDNAKFKQAAFAMYMCVYCKQDITKEKLRQARHYRAHVKGEDNFVVICPTCTEKLIEKCVTPIQAEKIALKKKNLVLSREGPWSEKDIKLKNGVDLMDEIIKEVIDS